MNKKIIFLVAIIAVLVIALQKVSSKKTIMVGTSSWPGWDLFEHAQKKGILWRITTLNSPALTNITTSKCFY